MIDIIEKILNPNYMNDVFTWYQVNEAIKQAIEETKDKYYTKEDLEAMLGIPCCHVTGEHDPEHYKNRKYICSTQKAKALEKFCIEIGINPQTKSDPDCYWCNKYPEKKNGENLLLFPEEQQTQNSNRENK